MASALSNHAGNAMLTYMFGQSGLYLALHVANPGVVSADALATEAAGGGYARQPISFSTPAQKAVVSTSRQRFAGMTSCIITDLGIWNAPTAGSLLASVAVLPNLSVPDGGLVMLARGDVAIQL